MMYEGFSCKVTVATNTTQSLDEVTYGLIDVVVAGYSRAHHAWLRL